MIVGNEEYKKWDGADFIESREAVCCCLEVLLKEGYYDLFPTVIDDVFRSKGLKQAAAEMDTTVEAIGEKIGKDTAPPFEVVWKLLDILGLELRALPKSA